MELGMGMLLPARRARGGSRTACALVYYSSQPAALFSCLCCFALIHYFPCLFILQHFWISLERSEESH